MRTRPTLLDNPLIAGCGCGWACLCPDSDAITDALPTGAVAIESVLAASERAYGFDRAKEDTDNLFAAYSVIHPRSHTELALVVWAGRRGDPWRESLLFEYCRLKAGGKPTIFNNPVFEQKELLLTIDTLGIPVFREHLDLIGRVVFNLSSKELYKQQDPKLFLDGVSRSRNPAAQSLTEYELVNCLQLIIANYGVSLPYYWCSAVLERAREHALMQNEADERMV